MIHLYVSTACSHAQHTECRIACKFCESPCLCPCHRTELLGRVNLKLDHIITQGEKLLMINQQTRDAMIRIDKATSDLAARVTAALARISTGMTEAEVTEINAELQAVADHLDGIAKDPENPTPAV